MDQNEIRALLNQGIEAARNNNKIIASSYFRRVIEKDPDNESAWMWMAQIADRLDERRECLLNVLDINPLNEQAREALSRIEAAMPDRFEEEEDDFDSL